MKYISFGLLLTLAACQPNNSEPTQISKPNQHMTSSVVQSKSDYQEKHRPQFHFSPAEMWMNDPNGMVYYDGEYHLFYQYYPDGDVWGPMHWGHAVSTDLVKWEHLPIALYPDELGYIFSGSAIVDRNNTSGFKTGNYAPLVAIFTYHDTIGERAGRDDFQTQGIAYSNDRGRSWTKYAENPVIPNPGIRDFRDPKVFWHEGTQRWVMILATGNKVQLYNSANLIDWQFASEFGEDQGSHGGVWECPDLFQLPIEGKEGESKWVMLVSLGSGAPNGGSGTMYFMGDFDGYAFSNDNPSKTVLWLDYGRDNYAGVSWSDIPTEDGRRIFMGWMSNWQYATKVPTSPWRSAMTVARELSLVQTDAGLRMKTVPVAELDVILDPIAGTRLNPREISGSMNLSEEFMFPLSTSQLDMVWDLSNSQADEVGVHLSNEHGQFIRIGFDKARKEFFVDRTQSGKMEFSDQFSGRHIAPYQGNDPVIQMRLLLDVASVEVFAQNGTVVMTETFFPDETFERISFYTEGGAATLKTAEAWQLNRIW